LADQINLGASSGRAALLRRRMSWPAGQSRHQARRAAGRSVQFRPEGNLAENGRTIIRKFLKLK
jgi:hypothetical protein